MDDRGQAAIRYNMISKAVEDATDERTGIFSPQKYFTSANKLKDAYGVFFKGGDKFEIDGFNNLMAHTTRAGQFAENPPTGQRVIPFLEGGAALAAIQHPLMVGAPALALIGGARALFNTAAGRGLLLKAAGLKPGTPVMNSFWQTKIAPVLGKGSAAAPIAAGAQQQQ